MASDWRPAGAEFLGTAWMVAIGTGSVAVGASNLVVSISFGFAVTTAILGLRHLSGAHINPAVSIAFTVTGHLPLARLPGYVIAQIGGGLVGSALILVMFGPERLGPTVLAEDISMITGGVVEVGITLVLMASILCIVALRDDSTPVVAGVVGATVAALALGFGPLTGASMNPARTFGPNLLSGQGHVLFYTLATVSGALVSALAWNRRSVLLEDEFRGGGRDLRWSRTPDPVEQLPKGHGVADVSERDEVGLA